MVVRNNIEIDAKVKCIENGTTQKRIAEDIETTKSQVNRIIRKQDGVVETLLYGLWKMTYEEAISEYEKRRETKLGRLIADRELPVLMKTWEFIDKEG